MFDINSILEILLYGKLPNWILTWKIVAIIISIVLLIGTIIFMIFSDYIYLKYFEDFEELQRYKGKKRGKKSIERKKERRFRKLILKFFSKISHILNVKKRRIGEDWERILKRIDEGRDIDYKLALIDADKMLNAKLEELGAKGRNLKEKLEKIPSKAIPNMEELKLARELLNQVLLGQRRSIQKKQVKAAVQVYMSVFNRL